MDDLTCHESAGNWWNRIYREKISRISNKVWLWGNNRHQRKDPQSINLSMVVSFEIFISFTGLSSRDFLSIKVNHVLLYCIISSSELETILPSQNHQVFINKELYRDYFSVVCSILHYATTQGVLFMWM